MESYTNDLQVYIKSSVYKIKFYNFVEFIFMHIKLLWNYIVNPIFSDRNLLAMN